MRKQDAREEEATYRRNATIAVMMGGFLSVFHISMINIALPEIQTAFGTDVETLKWVLNGLLVSMCVLMPMAGWLGRAMGLKNSYVLSFAIYAVVTILSGSAWSIDSLIVYQVVQGIGAGLLMPMTVAIISAIYPAEQRGRGMAFWGISTSLGGVVGYLVGGYLSDNFSWRLIFYINSPLALAGLVASLLFLRSDAEKVREKFDLWGFTTLSTAIVSLLVALSQGRVEGWRSDYIIGLLVTFVAAFGAWVAIEMQVSKPLIDLRLFRDKYFVSGTAICFIIGISLYGSNFLMPLFMQSLLAYTVLRTAVVMVPGVLISVFTARLSGLLADAHSPRLPLLMGIGFWAIFAYLFSLNDLRSSFSALVAVIILRGTGLGLTLTPMMSGALTTLPSRLTTMASGLLNLNFALGGMFGIAIVGTLLEKQELTHYANYASNQNFSSLATSNAISAFQSFFMGLGHVSVEAKGMAIAVLTKIVGREALISAFQDSFIFLMAATMVALGPAIIMKRAAGR